MKTSFSYIVIRYLHDVVGGEFVNVGIALFAPEKNYVNVICTKKYVRLSKLFLNVDGTQFRSIMNHIETKIAALKRQFENELQLDDKPKDILEIIKTIIPEDDSSIQFSTVGGGLTSDPKERLEQLYYRYVEQYSKVTEHDTRNDKDIWKIFKGPFEQRDIIKHLQTHIVKTNNFEYEFSHAWKNGQWSVLEPISFDIDTENAIKDKANKWIGRIIELQNSKEKFKPHFLIGKPKRNKLMRAYEQAENLLNNNIKIPKELIKEEEAESFADEVQREMQQNLDQ